MNEWMKEWKKKNGWMNERKKRNLNESMFVLSRRKIWKYTKYALLCDVGIAVVAVVLVSVVAVVVGCLLCVCVFGKRLIHSFSISFFSFPFHSIFWGLHCCCCVRQYCRDFHNRKSFPRRIRALIWKSGAHAHTRSHEHCKWHGPYWDIEEKNEHKWN